MKSFSKFALPLFFIAIFFSSCIGTSQITMFYLEKRNTRSVEVDPPPYFFIMVFTGGNVHLMHLSELEDFKKKYPSYSFLVSKDKESFYNERLFGENEKVNFHFKVEKISDEKQLIKLTSIGSKSEGTDIYEATEKEIFPKTSSEFNLRDAFLTLIISLTAAALACFIGYAAYRKLITEKQF